MSLRRLGAVLALVVLATCTGTGAVAAEPADACPPEGARVVVDFGDLVEGESESSLRTACDDDVSGERADKTITDAGFALRYATRQPDFVCRVDGAPSTDPCVNAAPADAYWSIWWAEADGEWVYSTRGVGTLRTPVGGHVALVWHTGESEAAAPTVSPQAAGEIESREDGVPASSKSDEGLPVWIPALVVVAVLAAAGAVVVRRRHA